MADLFKPIRTIKNKLDSIPIVGGQYILCTDTLEIFVDINGSTRVPYTKQVFIEQNSPENAAAGDIWFVISDN